MRRVLLPHHISEDPPPDGGVIHDFGGRSMGTSWSVRVVATAQPPGLQEGLQRQLDAVVAEMSHWEAGSDLGRFNRAPAGSWQVLPPAFFDVLSFALEVAQASRGACDPCAGALVNLWGFGPRGRYGEPDFVPPTAPQIQDALARHARQRAAFALEREGRRACQPGGLQLDLSAVAKGYSVDRLAYFLKSQGLRHYLVEVGGELRGAGVKPDGQPWWVALEQVADAGASDGPDELVLALHGLSVATSGDYRRYFRHDAQRYSHTIDPRSGAPIANDLASVTVLHPHCMAADAWSTALTVLGLEDGLALAERQGLAARFVVRGAGGLTEHMSRAMSAMLEE
jgi:thiamine biosynthesis lipoprotein